MSFKYLLIVTKRAYHDYCRGCYMGGSSEVFEFEYFNAEIEVINFIAKNEFNHRRTEYAKSDYPYIYRVYNSETFNDEEFYDNGNESFAPNNILEKSTKILEELEEQEWLKIVEQEKFEQIRREEALKQKALNDEKRDRELFLELKQRYEGSGV
jgi:hypothetical protein